MDELGDIQTDRTKNVFTTMEAEGGDCNPIKLA